jgi:hypothetical protein
MKNYVLTKILVLFMISGIQHRQPANHRLMFFNGCYEFLFLQESDKSGDNAGECKQYNYDEPCFLPYRSVAPFYLLIEWIEG